MNDSADPRSDPSPGAAVPGSRTTADPDELQDLHKFCREGQLYDVERWIEAGFPVNWPKAFRQVPALAVRLSVGADKCAELCLGRPTLECPNIQYISIYVELRPYRDES